MLFCQHLVQVLQLRVKPFLTYTSTSLPFHPSGRVQLPGWQTCWRDQPDYLSSIHRRGFERGCTCVLSMHGHPHCLTSLPIPLSKIHKGINHREGASCSSESIVSLWANYRTSCTHLVFARCQWYGFGSSWSNPPWGVICFCSGHFL